MPVRRVWCAGGSKHKVKLNKPYLFKCVWEVGSLRQQTHTQSREKRDWKTPSGHNLLKERLWRNFSRNTILDWFQSQNKIKRKRRHLASKSFTETLTNKIFFAIWKPSKCYTHSYTRGNIRHDTSCQRSWKTLEPTHILDNTSMCLC